MSDQKPFHLGWFLHNSTVQAWNKPWSGAIGKRWANAELYVDVARATERACFDYVLLEDNVYVPDAFGQSMDIYLRGALSVPRLDPLLVAPLMIEHTSRVGIVPTVSTFAHHPYAVARQIGTLDLLSGGRAGWNMVTGSSDQASRNFGQDGLADHDHRYEMASEYTEAVGALFDSWAPGAIVDDPVSGTFIDPSKVHFTNFAGQWYSTRGPLNSGPSPQGRPVIAQAGSSPRGQAYAAQYADTIIGQATSVAEMKTFRDSVRAKAVELGRDPDEIKVLFLVQPLVGESEAEAQEKYRLNLEWAEQNVELTLAYIGKMISIDFSVLPLDEPLDPEPLRTNGTQQTLVSFVERNAGRTLREAAVARGSAAWELPLVGSPDGVAGQMAEVMQEVGGDGFLIKNEAMSRRGLAEITDGLVPALQRRGLARTQYEHSTLRENLREF
jgi:FMN-dependent oxidoreductase (nitrilotriacetate monooxygenase family)